MFIPFSYHAHDVHFVSSSQQGRFHPGAVNYAKGKLITMGWRAAEFNSSCYDTVQNIDNTTRDLNCITLACTLLAADIVQYVDQSSKLYITIKGLFKKFSVKMLSTILY